MDKVICPHCGAENIKSSIITTCTHCLQSLQGAKPARTEPPAQRQAELSPAAQSPEAPPFKRPAVLPQTSPTPGAAFAQQLPQHTRGCRATVAIAAVGLFISFVLTAVLSIFFGVHPLLVIGPSIVIIVALAVGIFLLRIRIASSFYDAAIDEPPGQLTLGQSFEAGVTIRAKRDIGLGDAQAVLKCEEHAISRGGTSDTHYRKTIFEQACPLEGGRDLKRWEEAALRARITIPATAVPSLQGKNNFIEWKLQLTVPVPGYCPDIRRDVELWVGPHMGAGETPSVPQDGTIPRPWVEAVQVREPQKDMGTVRAQLEAAEGATVQDAPAMCAGATRKLNLMLRTDEDIHCRGVLCWVGCRIHGSGTDEEVALEEEHLIHEGDLRAAHPISYPITATIPQSGPVSFIGRYVKCEWMVRVRVDIPIWRDKRIELPFIVTPQLI